VISELIKKLNKKIVEEILNALEGTVWGMTIEEISEVTRRHRNTIAKYMPELEKAGLVVSRNIGKYTFWLLHTTFKYRKTDIARFLIQSLIKVLDEFLRKNHLPSPFEVGYKLGTLCSEYENIQLKGESKPIEIEYVLGIFVPTMLPRLSYRVEKFKPTDRKITISVANCPCDGKPENKKVCEFVNGFISGSLKYLGVPIVKSEEVKCQIDSAKACTFEYTLPITIEELSKKLGTTK